MKQFFGIVGAFALIGICLQAAGSIMLLPLAIMVLLALLCILLPAVVIIALVYLAIKRFPNIRLPIGN